MKWNLTLEPGTWTDLSIFAVVGLPKGKHAVISETGAGWQIDRAHDDSYSDITGPYESKEAALAELQKEWDELAEAISKNVKV